MERTRLETIAAFYTPDPLVAGVPHALGEDAAHHMRVRRLVVGARVRLLDGAGAVAQGVIARLGKHQALVDVDEVAAVPALPPVHLGVPIADRERMLLLAEKCVELGASSWRPVLWRRSRSVSPRGEGIAFQGKLRARMVSALAQSEGGWLPDLYPVTTVERLAAATPPGPKLLLDPAGAPILETTLAGGAVTLVAGPEGGIDADEHDLLVAAGFVPVSLAGHILRFETAAIAALAIVRAALATAPVESPPHG